MRPPVRGLVIKTIIMKPVLAIFSHPIMQVAAFLMILFGGQVFILPYWRCIRYALPDGEWFAITGLVAVVITLASIVIRRFPLQVLGLAVMWLSLFIFLGQLTAVGRQRLFEHAIEYIMAILFIVVSALVTIKHFRWKNY